MLPLDNLKTIVATAERDELPAILGQLKELEAIILVRLHTPPPAVVRPPDRLLTVEEAAARLGCSEGYLYNNWRKLPFSVKTDYGLRFSERGIEDYIHTRSYCETKMFSTMGTPNVPAASKLLRRK